MNPFFTNDQAEQLRAIAEQEYGRSFDTLDAREMANNLHLLYETLANIVRENPELQDQVNQLASDFSDNV